MKRRTFCQVAGLTAGSLMVPSFLARGASLFDGTADEVVHYGVQVATTPSFAPGSLVLEVGGLAEPAYRMADLKPQTTYYWRANVSDGVRTSPWSEVYSFTAAAAVGVDEPDVPETYELGANYPNPFNPVTTIPFTLPQAGMVQLRVYNQLGQEVATLVDGPLQAGRHEATWSAQSQPSGTYFCILKAGSFTQSRTMVLVK
jgi:hypothetical protein